MGVTGERRQDELTALYRVASLSIAHGDMAAVANEVVRALGATVPCERCLLFLFDDDASEFVLHTGAPESEGLRVGVSDAPFMARVLTQRVPEFTNDLPAEVGSNAFLTTRFGARQAIIAPVAVGESSFGVLCALDSKRGAFTESELRIVTILADRAAMTIETARLVTTLQRQIQEFEALQRLTTLLTSSENLEHVIEESMRIVCDLVQCQRMVMLLHDGDENALVIQPPVLGMDASEVERMQISLAEPSLGGTVFRTNTPLVSNDAETDQWVSPHFKERFEIENLLVVPLGTGTRPIGILKAINAQKGFFDEDDLRFTNILGGRVGAVIENTLARERERRLMERLREADRTKTEFVSMLAHELRGPMTTVTGFSYALRDQGDALGEQKKKDILGIIVREVERLSRMVNDLLDVSRMESGTLSYDFAPVSIEELIDGILEVHASFHANHAVVTEIEPGMPKVIADRDRLSQVLINLVTNATRYSPEGTNITIGAKLEDERGDEVRVWVSDEGIGISEDDKGRIFEKFSMLPKPGWVKKGTGLGLFITKGIVDAHGGRITVDSLVGRGTTFRFTLPVARDEA